MSDAEHIIENAIYALKENKDICQILDDDINKTMLNNTGMDREDVIAIAYHIVYSLYDGKFPE